MDAYTLILAIAMAGNSQEPLKFPTTIAEMVAATKCIKGT
jgi:hypothetical protein